MRHRCRLGSETGWAEFGYFLRYFKVVAPRALVIRTLVKGNEHPRNEIGETHKHWSAETAQYGLEIVCFITLQTRSHFVGRANK